MASTVIIGGGIIGLSTAYYLSQHQPGSSIHIVDTSPELFASASGYAGGFLAKSNWFSFDPSVSALATLSFDEHQKLAEQEGGREKWEYTKTTSLRYTRTNKKDNSDNGTKDWMEKGKSRAIRSAGQQGDDYAPAWLKRVGGDEVALIDDKEETAIVDPLKLCQFLLQKCKHEGVQIHHPATVLSIGTDVQDELSCVCIGYTNSSTETEIPTTRILLSAGAWTPQLFKSLFKSSSINIPVYPMAGHSLVVKKPNVQDDTNHIVFATVADGSSPEFGSRSGGVIYFAGVNSMNIPLPPLATASKKEDESLTQLKQMAKALVNCDEELQTMRTGLCFRPVTERGAPYIGRLTDEQVGLQTRTGEEGGVFIAVGHGPWGILMSLGTGRVMAEMMAGKETSVDVSGLAL